MYSKSLSLNLLISIRPYNCIRSYILKLITEIYIRMPQKLDFMRSYEVFVQVNCFF